jgi:hypothetical protein
MMLSLVAEKDDAPDTLIARSVKKSVHLTRRKEAGFIHDPELLVGGGWRWILHQARDSARVYARFRKRPDSPRGWGEALHQVAMLLDKFGDRANSGRLCAPGAAFDSGQPIVGRQSDVCHLNLIGEQATLCRPLLDFWQLGNRLSSTVTSSHQVQVVALKRNHLGRGEGSLRGGSGGGDGQEQASLLAPTIFIPYLVQIRSAHSVLERRSFQCSAIDNRFALGGVSEGETNRVLRLGSRRWLNRCVSLLEVDSVYARSDSPFLAKLVFAAVIF